MVVGGEQRLGLQFFGTVLQHRPGDRHPIKGGGAPADLVQDQQAVPGGGAEDVGHLRHLHHKGGLSGGQVVAGADAGEDAIHHADVGAAGGNEAAHLRHQDDQRHLPHIGGLTGHIGAGDDADPLLLGTHQGVVGDEQGVRAHLLHHRVAAGLYLDDAGLVHAGAAVVVLHRHGGKGAKRIQLGDKGRGQLHTGDGLRQPGAQGGEQLVLQRGVPVLGGEHVVLQILQLLGDVALAVDQRLLADIVGGHLILEGIGYLDIIAEYLVVADLQGADAGLFLFLRLHLRQKALAAVEDAAQAIHLRVEAVPDHLALPDGERRLVHQRLPDEGRQIVEILQLLIQLVQRSGGKRCQLGLHGGEPLHGGAEGHQIPPAGGAVDHPADEPLHIRDAAEGQYQLLPGYGVLRQRRHGAEPPVDGGHVHQRLLEPCPQVAGAHGGLGLVQHPQQTAALLLAPQRLRQLQIAAGGQIQLHVLAGAVPRQLVEVAQIGLLRLVEIAQQAAQRQQRRHVVPGQALQRVLPELGAHLLLRLLRGKPGGGQLFQVAGKPLPQRLMQRLVKERRLVHHRLGGGEASQLVEQGPHPVGAGKHRGLRLAGGHVAGAQARAGIVQIYAAQVVAALGAEAGLVNDGAGGDDADDIPLHQPLGGGGILRLLADGHLVALGDETGDIGVGGVVGDAAHGDLVVEGLGLILVPCGQSQIQLTGRRAGVGAEHLVEVAQTEKQNGVGVLLLDLHILAHHGGQLCHGEASFGGKFIPARRTAPMCCCR